MVEHVRARLARQICAQNTSHERLPAADRAVGALGAGVRGIDRRPGRGAQPRDAALEAVGVHDRWCATRFEQAAREGEAPVLVTSAAIRPFVRSLVERFRAQTTVLSQAEIHPRARLKTVGSV